MPSNTEEKAAGINCQTYGTWNGSETLDFAAWTFFIQENSSKETLEVLLLMVYYKQGVTESNRIIGSPNRVATCEAKYPKIWVIFGLGLKEILHLAFQLK